MSEGLNACREGSAGSQKTASEAALGEAGTLGPAQPGKGSRVQRAYKTELDPTKEQVAFFRRCAGAARWVYNYGLARKKEEYEKTKKSPRFEALCKEIVLLKKKPETAWLAEVPSSALLNALLHLDRAYQHFFRRVKQGQKPGFPRFKSKHRSVLSFRMNGLTERHIHSDRVQLPKVGDVHLKERGYLAPGTRIVSAAVSERAGRWFVSLAVEEEHSAPPEKTEVGGGDLGISTLIQLSDGTAFGNPRVLKSAQRKLAKLQRSVARKVKGSRNREKAKKKVAKLHYRIACVRQNTIHEATTAIAKRFGVFGIEDLHVAGMTKNHNLAQALADSAFGEIRRQLEYKGLWHGCKIVVAPRFFPSTKTCSRCGLVKEQIGLGERTFHCEGCGLVLGRDLNAAINLKKYAEAQTGGPSGPPPAGMSPEGQNACGEGSAGSQKTAGETSLEEAGTFARTEEPDGAGTQTAKRTSRPKRKRPVQLCLF